MFKLNTLKATIKMIEDLYALQIDFPLQFKKNELKTLIKLQEDAILNEHLTKRPLSKLKTEIDNLKTEISQFPSIQVLSRMNIDYSAKLYGENYGEVLYKKISVNDR